MNSMCMVMTTKILTMVTNAASIDPDLMKVIEQQTSEINESLNKIEPQFLRAGIDVQDIRARHYALLDVNNDLVDPQRFSDILAMRALLELLNNNLNDNTKIMFVKCIEATPKNAVSQYAKVLNSYANFCLAYAALLYCNLIYNGSLIAQSRLEAIDEHLYAKIGKKFFNYNLQRQQMLDGATWLNMATADELVATAIELYTMTFTLTQNTADHEYAKAAQKSLTEIHCHPLCQSDPCAMDIVNTKFYNIATARLTTLFDRLENSNEISSESEKVSTGSAHKPAPSPGLI